MPKPKKGPRLGGSASHQRKILANLATQLFVHHSIVTTDAKAKLLRPYVEKLITKAKRGTLADRRNVMKLISDKEVVSNLFTELADYFADRPGGYTRIVKVENRRGDNAPMSRISLVLEETVTAEATRATRAAASKRAADVAEAKAQQAEGDPDAPEVEGDPATDEQAKKEAEELAAAAADEPEESPANEQDPGDAPAPGEEEK